MAQGDYAYVCDGRSMVLIISLKMSKSSTHLEILHAPMNYIFALCCALTHSLYQKKLNGLLRKRGRCCSFEFRAILLEQLLKLDPKHIKCAGDDQM